MIDNKTPNLQLPLPDKANLMSIDVERIITSITLIDKAYSDLTAAIDEFKQSVAAANDAAAQQMAAQLDAHATATANQLQTMTSATASQLSTLGDELKKVKILAMAGLA